MPHALLLYNQSMNLKQTIQKTKCYQFLNAYRWREHMTHPGKDFPDKTFYVIRRHANRAGLFSFYVTNLGSIVKAKKQGYIPVVDMQNSPNPMLTPERVGRENAFEDYFLQPEKYHLGDITHAKNVILGAIDLPEYFPDDDLLLTDNQKELLYWRKAARQYMRLRPEITSAIENAYQSLSEGERMLGVLCRGTDYLALRPAGHPVQPDPKQVIADCRQIMMEQHCEKIYLATEDASIWEQFQAAFPGQVVSYQRHHYTTKAGENLNDVANRETDPKIRNTEYLISIGILSHCPCFTAGITSGSLGACIMSKGFEYEHIYRLGRYES